MNPTAARPGPIDRRLVASFPVARRYMIGASVAQAIATIALIFEMVAVSSLIAATLLATPHTTNRGVAIGVAFGAALVRGGVLFVSERAGVTMTATVLGTLAEKVTKAVAQRSPRARAGEKAGELAVAITRGVEQLEGYFARYLPALIQALLIPIIVLVWIATVDLLSAGIIVALLCVIPFAMAHFGRQAAVTNERTWRSLSSLAGRFHELVSGLATLRALGREAEGRAEVEGATTAVSRATMATIKVAFRSSLALEFLAGVGVGLVAMMLGFRLLWGQIPLASALAILLVTPEVFLPLRRVGTEFHAAAEGRTAAARLFELIDAVETSPRSHGMAHVDLSAEPFVLEGLGVVGPDGNSLFAPLTMTIAPRTHVTISGRSGIGKTTLLHVLAGLESPSLGTLRVGEADVATLDLDAFWRQIAIVPQHPHLFADTLAANLTLGAPNFSDDALARVVDLCALRDVVASLPDGLNTKIGEGGASLSAGERQRVAIARAVVRDAPVVFFDEATSGLDPATVQHLRDALRPWLSGRTVVSIDHSISFVDDAERPIVLAAPVGLLS